MNYNELRRKTKKIKVGNIYVGGDSPVTIQSMTNTDTHNIEATYRQASALERAGCDILRITVPDEESCKIFSALKERGIKIPLVADVHFSHKIAVAAIENGADKVRINPGNIGSEVGVVEVVNTAKAHGVPIRIGVNAGSLSKEILAKYGRPTPEALVESAMEHVEILEKHDFRDIIISIKASTVEDMISANKLLSSRVDYPLHLGVTEAGFGAHATVKSSVGIGSLLSMGIGDTIRVSLTDKPEEEINIAEKILSSLGMREEKGMNIVSCPTCGRTKIDLISLTREFSEKAQAKGITNIPIKVALMGCVVNGPGEAREADIGIAGGVGEGLLFKNGEIIRKISEGSLVDELIAEIIAMQKTEK